MGVQHLDNLTYTSVIHLMYADHADDLANKSKEFISINGSMRRVQHPSRVHLAQHGGLLDSPPCFCVEISCKQTPF